MRESSDRNREAFDCKVTSIIQPPPPQLLDSCDRLERLIGEVIAAKNEAAAPTGRFEAPVEAAIQLNLVVRYLEGVISLARHDLVLLPAAIVLTRAAFEGGLRSWWLLAPNGEFEREARWLAHLAEEETMWERLARLMSDTGEPVGDYAEWAQSIYAFRMGVVSKLPPNVTVPDGPANLRAIAKEMGEERRYSTYVLLSQYVHGGHFAGNTYRAGLGNKKQFGERVSLREWAQCLRISWWALYRATSRFIEIAATPGIDLGKPEQFASLEASLKAIEAI